MTCAKCGKQAQGRKFCKDCSQYERRDPKRRRTETSEERQIPHRCTACGTLYLRPRHSRCPECESPRRRFAGDDVDPSDLRGDRK